MTTPSNGATSACEPCTRLLDLTAVKGITDLSKATIYKGLAEGWFPQPRRVGPKAIRWIEAEVRDWIAALPEARYAAPRQEQ